MIPRDELDMDVESEEFMGVLMATDREIHKYGRYGKVERYVTVYDDPEKLDARVNGY